MGIGSDFDGIEVAPDGLEDISKMPVLFEELRRRGYSESDLTKLASGLNVHQERQLQVRQLSKVAGLPGWR